MSILSCEHHNGMGLCSQCSKEIDHSYERERNDRCSLISKNRDLLLRVADILYSAGEYSLSDQIKSKL